MKILPLVFLTLLFTSPLCYSLDISDRTHDIFVCAKAQPYIKDLTSWLVANFRIVERTERKIIEPRPRVQGSPNLAKLTKARPLRFSFLVAVVVGSDGAVSDAHIISSSDATTNQKMKEAAEKWTFVPGKVDNKRATFLYTCDYQIEIQ